MALRPIRCRHNGAVTTNIQRSRSREGSGVRREPQTRSLAPAPVWVAVEMGHVTVSLIGRCR